MMFGMHGFFFSCYLFFQIYVWTSWKFYRVNFFWISMMIPMKLSKMRVQMISLMFSIFSLLALGFSFIPMCIISSMSVFRRMRLKFTHFLSYDIFGSTQQLQAISIDFLCLLQLLLLFYKTIVLGNFRIKWKI